MTEASKVQEHHILWTRDMLKRFKRTYVHNVAQEGFMFDGHHFITGYAKYLIEYLTGRFK